MKAEIILGNGGGSGDKTCLLIRPDTNGYTRYIVYVIKNYELADTQYINNGATATIEGLEFSSVAISSTSASCSITLTKSDGFGIVSRTRSTSDAIPYVQGKYTTYTASWWGSVSEMVVQV